MRGLIHIYCGNGKGKTTAAVGLAVRCAGGGGRVLFCQFMKGNASGERKILSELENVTLMPAYERSKFVWNMTEEEKRAAQSFYRAEFEKAAELCADYDMLVLDEIMSAVKYGFVEEERLVEFLKTRPDGLEAVMTGRNPSERLLELADYVSEIVKVKHPYDKGIRARKFIES